MIIACAISKMLESISHSVLNVLNVLVFTGPTLKLKRPVVAQMYESSINSLYEENDPQ